jgi:hypothetical protein
MYPLGCKVTWSPNISRSGADVRRDDSPGSAIAYNEINSGRRGSISSHSSSVDVKAKPFAQYLDLLMIF